jgi:hypothetical protein
MAAEDREPLLHAREAQTDATTVWASIRVPYYRGHRPKTACTALNRHPLATCAAGCRERLDI